MSLKAGMEAHAAGYAENLYLDSESRAYVEETGGANVLFVAKDARSWCPSPIRTRSCPPSRAFARAGCQGPGITVDERPVTWAEVQSGAFTECGLCGTAAVISLLARFTMATRSWCSRLVTRRPAR